MRGGYVCTQTQCKPRNSAIYGTVWSGRWGMLVFTSRIMCSQNTVLQLLLFTPYEYDLFFWLPPPLLKHCQYRNALPALIGWCKLFHTQAGLQYHATLRIGGTSAGPRHMMAVSSQPNNSPVPDMFADDPSIPLMWRQATRRLLP